jgi:hypothetical protein
MEAPALLPIDSGDLSDALEKPLTGESRTDRALRLAGAKLEEARDLMGRFEQTLARRALEKAEALLLMVEPDERVADLLAEVTFQLGLVHLRDQNRGLAIDAFRQTLRLTPERERLDPARYPPEVIQAFAAAQKSTGAAVPLDVSSAFYNVQVYLDGVRVGATPLHLQIAPGPHYLLLYKTDHETEGLKLNAAPREPVSVNAELKPLPIVERASEMRRRLASAPGKEHEALRAAAREVADIAGVNAVLVVGDGPGLPAVAVYESDVDRLSMFRPVDAEVTKLFGLLLPAPAPAPLDLVVDLPEEEPSPWYLRPWGVGALGGGAILAVLGVVLLSGQPLEAERTARWGGFQPP